MSLIMIATARADETDGTTSTFACRIEGADQLRLSERAEHFRLELVAKGKTVASLDGDQLASASAVQKHCGDLNPRADEGKVDCTGHRIRWFWYIAHVDTELELRYEKGQLRVTSCEHSPH